MALNLISATRGSTAVHVHDRSRASADPLIAAGATWHDSARSLAAAADIVILMVPELAHVRQVLEGDEGLLSGFPGDAVICVSSTVSAEGIRELAAELAEAGSPVRVVDAPVSGGEEGAREGTLSIMIGGESEDVARVVDVYSTMGTPVHLGPLGAGQIAKACNQVIVAATMAALSEAALLAERAGLDVLQLFDLLEGGYAGSRLMHVKKQRLATHDDSPSGPAKFMIKDLGVALEEGARTSAETPITRELLKIYTDLTAAGLGDRDTSAVLTYLDSVSGPNDRSGE
ncbi:NAD(P)-dependent oxidoreductase [Demequina capsici]|uniref:NAD(P)-dependent oxidoreductase n=1 Tax=Demequina capsici TaxID=3075620 RepID=A0AA96F541_9MICO|nr:NAD(P)-dependent oxidoreductase [Demequina sp. OYTSA14]WNM23599.1 NAD(P)-dependent oxidoreductase [Demequina sp. OYTSA14]